MSPIARFSLWDYRLEQWINGPAGSSPGWDTLMRAVAASGEVMFIALVVAWCLYGSLRGGPAERQASMTALLAAGAALLVNVIVSHLWSRTRPFVAHPNTVHVLLSHSKDASFPSDHAAAAFAISLVLLAEHRKLGTLALAFAVLMSYARVYVGDHYPTDVIAGAAVGLLLAGVFLSWWRPLMFSVAAVMERLMAGVHVPLADGPARNERSRR